MNRCRDDPSLTAPRRQDPNLPMRITKDTPEMVVIEDRPRSPGLFLICIILSLAYVGLLFLGSGNWMVCRRHPSGR